jgi:hypothetical protein
LTATFTKLRVVIERPYPKQTLIAGLFYASVETYADSEMRLNFNPNLSQKGMANVHKNRLAATGIDRRHSYRVHHLHAATSILNLSR